MNDSLYLKADSISFSYPDNGFSIQNLSLEVRRGSVVGLIGPNGSGKSTFLKVLAGLISPSAGTVSLMAKDLRSVSRSEIARLMAYLPQKIPLSFGHSVEEIVSYGRFPYQGIFGFLAHQDNEVIDRCLQQTQVKQLRHKPVHQISGGEQQRVYLASILAQEPAVLLLDEPTSGLDLHHQTVFHELLRSLSRQGMAIVSVTHELNQAAHFCHEILLMDSGKCVARGRPQQIFTREILEPVYGERIHIGKLPVTGQVFILPKGRE